MKVSYIGNYTQGLLKGIPDEIYFKINEILSGIQNTYDIFFKFKTEQNISNEIKNDSFAEREKEIILANKYWDALDNIHNIKNEFIDYLTNDSQKKILKNDLDKLENLFKNLDVLFEGKKSNETYHILDELYKDSTVEYNADKNVIIADIMHLVLSSIVFIERSKYEGSLIKYFKNIKESSKEIHLMGKELEKINNSNNVLSRSESNDNSSENQGVDKIKEEKKINEKISSLQRELEINRVKINARFEYIRKLSEAGNSILNISNLIDKHKKSMEYVDEIINVEKKELTLIDEIRGLEGQRLENKELNLFRTITNNKIITSNSQVSSFTLNRINKRILINHRNIYSTYKKIQLNLSEDINDRLNLLYGEFRILHERKHQILAENPTSHKENKKDSLNINILNLANDIYINNLKSYALEKEKNNLDKAISTQQESAIKIILDHLYPTISKEGIATMIEQKGGEITIDMLATDTPVTAIDSSATINNTEVLVGTVSSMKDQPLSLATTPIIENHKNTLLFTGHYSIEVS